MTPGEELSGAPAPEAEREAETVGGGTRVNPPFGGTAVASANTITGTTTNAAPTLPSADLASNNADLERELGDRST